MRKREVGRKATSGLLLLFFAVLATLSQAGVASAQLGEPYAFGSNLYGQLGTQVNSESTNPSPTPSPVTLPFAGGPATQLATGEGASFAVTNTGQLYAWGDNYFGQLGIPTNSGATSANVTPTLVTLPGATGPVSTVAAGASHTLVVTSTGQLYAFGLNRFGQLGSTTRNGTEKPSSTPTLVTLPGEVGGVIAVAAGANQSLAVTSSGQLYAFGLNNFGQLGIKTNSGTEKANPTPTLVTLPGKASVVQVGAGENFSLAVTSGGQLYTFGLNHFGQLGYATNDGTQKANNAPTLVTLPGATGTVSAVAAGASHSLVATSSGQLYAFGSNQYGQLGSETNSGTETPNPTPALVTLPGAIGTVTQVGAGRNDSLAVTTSGQLFAFGEDRYGQLGNALTDETEEPNPTPALVSFESGAAVQTVARGPAAQHTLALVTGPSGVSPTVETSTASSVTHAAATLNATVNPDSGAVTSCRFEYGTTTSYGASVPCATSPGSGSSAVAVSATARGLAANTTYHFRVVATNAGGTSFGIDQTLTTPEVPPPTVATEPATTISQSSVTLNATVNPNGEEVTECRFEYGITTLYGSSVPCSSLPGSGESAVAVSAPVTGLVTDTTYHFRIVATSATGTSRSGDATFSTAPPAPTVATGAASAVTRTSAALSATVNPNGGEVSECRFEYGTSLLYGSSVPCASLPGSGSSAVEVSGAISELLSGTTYYFRVVATNAGGTSVGAAQSFVTQPPPPAPSVVTGAASAVTQTTATLNATVNPNGEEVSECRFEYGTTTSYGSSAPCSSLPGAGLSPVPVSASIGGLTADSPYYFRIVATGPGGTSDGVVQSVTTLPNPPTVSVVTGAASSITETSATLNAGVNPNGSEVTECHFEYGTSTSYGSSVPCSSLPGGGESTVTVSAAISGLTPDTTYYFRIVATNTGGTSDGIDQSFTTQAPPPPPATVTGAASSVTETEATLNATVNPNGEEVSECYFEYGTTTSYGSNVPCLSLPGSGDSPVTVSAAISALTPNTTYYFRIVATGPGGTDEGADGSLTTQPLPTPSVATGSASSVTKTTATLNATVDPNGGAVSACYFEYGTTTGYGSNVPCSSSPGSGDSPVAVSAAISGLTPETTYYFRIVATGPGGTHYGATSSLTTSSLPTPTVVTGSASSVTKTTATLNATVDPNGGEVSECRFEYGTSIEYSSSVPCASLPGSGHGAVAVSAAVTHLSPGTTYYFRIVATGPGGTSLGQVQSLATQALPAPIVTTGAASGVTPTTATLNATVNPNGEQVTACRFEYGTTTSYGSSVPCSSLPGSGDSAVAVSASLSGLSPDTTYYFRIVATGPGGTSYGADASTTTPESAPVVVTGSATSVTKTSATLNATVNPEGATVSACYFEYGTTTAYGSHVACSSLPGSGGSSVPVSASVTGLTAGTIYHFRIVATNRYGTEDGADRALATVGAPEFGRCQKAPRGTGGYTGSFTSKNCLSETTGGKYEWDGGVVHSGFRVTSKKGQRLETASGTIISCRAASGSGEYTGHKGVTDVLITFTGCGLGASKHGPHEPCTSPGQSEGTLQTSTLEGTLGWESKPEKKAALALYPVGGSGTLLAFSCGALEATVSGSVLASVRSGKMSSAVPLKFVANDGTQMPGAFEGESPDVLSVSLNGGSPEPIGLTANLSLASEEEIEVNTTA